MSSHNDRVAVINERERTDICRDFMRNACDRGAHCKFYHPPKADGDDGSAIVPEFQFCIAFRSARGCIRAENCRYVHATHEEVDAYNSTGDISPPLARAIAAAKDRARAPASSGGGGPEPVCMDFQRGECHRGNQCRYRHVGGGNERDSGVWERPPYAGGAAGAGPIWAGNEHSSQKRGRYEEQPPMMQPQMMNQYVQQPSYEQHPQAAAFELQQARQTIADLKRENDVLRALAEERQQRYDDLYAVFRQVTQLRQQ